VNLFKTSFYSVISTFIRTLAGIVAGKVVAVYTGPTGVALLGQFNNFINISTTFANGGINTGVVKYTAEYGNNEQKINSLFSTSFKVTLYTSGIIGLALMLFSYPLSGYLFANSAYASIFIIFGCSIVLYALNSLFLSILNGSGDIKALSYVNMSSNIAGLLFTVVLVHYLNIYGALLSIILAQSIVFCISGYVLMKRSWFKLSYFFSSFDTTMLKKLSAFSLMAIVSALTVPLSQIILRQYLIQHLSVQSAGIWQGVNSISNAYLLLASSAISIYYLPKLASLKTKSEIRHEIHSGYKMILPVMAVCCMAIYLFRSFIIKLLFTKAFTAMNELFLFQMLGDLLKVGTWILAYLMLAKSMTRLYIITEVFFHVLYVVLGYFLVNRYGLVGITYAFAINYFIFFITLVYIFRRILFKKKMNRNYK